MYTYKSVMEYDELPLDETIKNGILDIVSSLRSSDKDKLIVRMIKEDDKPNPYKLFVFKQYSAFGNFVPTHYPIKKDDSVKKEEVKKEEVNKVEPAFPPPIPQIPPTIPPLNSSSVATTEKTKSDVCRSPYPYCDDSDDTGRYSRQAWNNYYQSSQQKNDGFVLEEANADSPQKVISEFFNKIIAEISRQKKSKEKEFFKLEKEMAVFSYLSEKILKLLVKDVDNNKDVNLELLLDENDMIKENQEKPVAAIGHFNQI